MGERESETVQLLKRWHGGDRKALDALVERDLPWIQSAVRARLGPALRSKAETQDFVQEVLIQFLEYGPRFLPRDRQQFRALLARIAENVIRHQVDWYTAQRRSLYRERPLPGDSVLRLDGSFDRQRSPSEEAAGREGEALVRFCLELTDPEDREVLVARNWEKLSFGEIARRLGISENAARQHYHRALARMAEKIDQIRQGTIEEFLSDLSEGLPPVL